MSTTSTSMASTSNGKTKRNKSGETKRKQIVGALKFVDCVVPQDSYDKADQYDRYKFDIMFVGDDWYQDPKWQNYERDFEEKNVRIVYFPYYKGTSSTIINNVLNSIKSNEKI